jgi:hypothetical protein
MYPRHNLNYKRVHKKPRGPVAFGANRALYDYVKKKYPSGDVVITESYIRSELVLGTQNSLSFNILQNVGIVRPSEHRLSQADRFVANEVGFFLQRSSTTAGATSQTLLHTYPNPNVFPEASALNSCYNGFATFKIGPTTYYDSLDVLEFMRIGIAQQGLATIGTAALPGTSPVGAYAADQWTTANYGFKSLTPSMEISGLDKTTFDITLPESSAMGSAAAGFNNVAILFFRGFLIQNGANHKPAF